MKPHRRKPGAGRGVWVREDRLPTLAELTWLASPQGQSVCREMDLGAPADTPAQIARWRERLEPDLVSAAWSQVLLRRRARAKFTRAADMLFDRVGLEQATDEVVAAHKAKRFSGLRRVADLCCGLGGDTIALAERAEVIGVDFSPLRARLAEHNAAAYGRSVVTLTDDVAFCRPEVDAVHLDPDRRPTGPRRHEPDTASPDIATLRQILSHYPRAAVKLSPGADFAALGFEAEIEVVSHRGECKQAIAWTGGFQQARRRATSLPTGASMAAVAGEDLTWPAPASITSEEWLFEPDPAVIRADLVGVLARRHHLAPVDPLIAYLVGPTRIDSPFLAAFRVAEMVDFSAAAVRQLLARHDVGAVEIKMRGFAVRPEEVRRLVRTAGKRPATLFLTRAGGRPRAILAERPADEP